MGNSPSTFPAEDFDCLFEKVLRDPSLINVLYRHDVFLNRGYRICRWHLRGTGQDPWELFSTVFIKVVASKGKLRLDNTPNAKAFFGLFSQITLNVLRDQWRKDKRQRNRLMSLSLPDEETSDGDPGFDLADPGVDLNGERLLEEFMEFTSTLPRKRRRAIMLRLDNYPDKGCSFEKIAKTLNSEGVECTHVTVRAWVRADLKAFFDGSRVSSGKKAASF